MTTRIIFSLSLFLLINLSFGQTDDLRNKIEEIIKDKKATVGIAIKGLEDGDTLSINGSVSIPMFSVVKFPTAMAVLHQVDKGKISMNQKIRFKRSELQPDTHSPMRDENLADNFEMKVSDLLSYAVSQSDNIAYEKLAELLGGIDTVNQYVRSLGLKNTTIVSTYKDGLELTLKNRITALDAVTLLQKAYQEKLFSKKSKAFLWKIMKETRNAPDRIKGLLPQGTVVAHKSGSSGIDNDGTVATHDIGVVTLPSGKHFAIAVLVYNSKENEAVNVKIIADISKAAYDYFVNKGK